MTIEKIPGRAYVAHIGTKNKSFIAVSDILKKEGIKNNKFMLALFDESIAELDPFDEANLTELEKTKILIEIIKNPWYFIREVVRVPVSGGTVLYELNLGNLFLTWCMISNLNCYLLLPRQNYKTVSACVFYLWIFGFGTKNTQITFFNKALDDAKNNLNRVKDLRDELPKWISIGILTDPVNDRNNIDYIYSAHRKNTINPKPPGKDPVHASKLGRGNTTPLVWYDEIAFTGYIRQIYMAAVPAQSKAKLSAIEMGVPYGTVTF
jgi:hypothetical protein